MPNVGMLRSALMAVVAKARAGLEDLTAASLLEEAFEALCEARAAHWADDDIAAVPDMIRELARDRDDYKLMAEAYRQDLAKAEAELTRLHNLSCRWRHEAEEKR